MTELILVRHGETTGQSSIRLHGHNDVPLSALGILQLEAVAQRLGGEQFDRLIASPLRRSRRGAELISRALGPPVPAIEEIEAFREINFGDWEGLTLEEVAERDPAGHRAWARRTPEFCFPGGESRLGFFERVAGATREQLAAPGPRVLAVLHKGVLKALLRALLDPELGSTQELPVHLGSIHRAWHDGSRWILRSLNETDHLGPHHIPE